MAVMNQKHVDTLLGEEAILEAIPAGRIFPFHQGEMPFLFMA